MGHPKQLLAWGQTTVLGQTLHHVAHSQAQAILVVVGHEAAAVAALAAPWPTLYNPDYATGEMLSSLQLAVRGLPAGTEAMLVVLADQPMVTTETMNLIMAAFRPGQTELIVPTYNGQRGNPVLIGSRYFDDLLQLPAGAAPRDLFKGHTPHFLPLLTDTILQDLDRPEEYQRYMAASNPTVDPAHAQTIR